MNYIPLLLVDIELLAISLQVHNFIKRQTHKAKQMCRDNEG